MLGVVFPGQGSQAIGMLKDIAESYPEVIQTFHAASEVLGYDLWTLIAEGPAAQLDQTTHTQPALLVGGYAIWKILQKYKNFTPDYLAGHSLGEYTALVCADALSFKEAVKLVALRGALMQEAVPEGEGALAAIIGLDDQSVEALCSESIQLGEVLTPANFNCPLQVVIAGHRTAVLRAMTSAKAAGAKLAKLLPVSVPSHCRLMAPAALKLKNALATIAIAPPRLPVINNVAAQLYTSPT